MAEKRAQRIVLRKEDRAARFFFWIEPVLCLAALIVQIVGFSTNAWMINLEKSNNRLTYFGIWSTTVCYDLDCITRTHVDQYRENMSKAYTHTAVQYALQLGHQVLATIALSCAALCFVMSITHFFTKVSKLKLKLIIGMLVTSYISGALLLTTVGYFWGELSAFRSTKENALKFTFYHAWGLASSFSGAVLITCNGFILTFILCCRSNRTFEDTDSTYGSVIQSKQDIPESVPHQCADYDPPDYNDLEQDQDSDSEEDMIGHV